MTDKLVRVNLDGTGVTASGEEVKTKFFKLLAKDLDDYSDISFTREEAIRINNHISKLSTGSTAMVPLICMGREDCPFSGRCPLAEIEKCPVGRACLLELNMIKQYILEYMTDYQVDPDNFTEVSYCRDLAEIEIYLWRLNVNLAKPANAELIVNQPMGTDRNGNPILQKQVSPFMDLKEKLLARKSRIIKLMVGDRQERYKKEAALKKKEEDDVSSTQAKLREKIEELQRKLEGVSIVETSRIPTSTLTPNDLIASDE
jgi:hypothetical protein